MRICGCQKSLCGCLLRCQSLKVSPQAQTVHAAFVRCAGWVQHAKVSKLWNMHEVRMICNVKKWVIQFWWLGISAKSPEAAIRRPGQERSELPSENALFSCLVDLGLTGARWDDHYLMDPEIFQIWCSIWSWAEVKNHVNKNMYQWKLEISPIARISDLSRVSHWGTSVAEKQEVNWDGSGMVPGILESSPITFLDVKICIVL